MKALTIVIDLQERENSGTGMGVGQKDMEIDTLGFESTKEALHDGIIVAVAFAAHADGDVVQSE